MSLEKAHLLIWSGSAHRSPIFRKGGEDGQDLGLLGSPFDNAAVSSLDRAFFCRFKPVIASSLLEVIPSSLWAKLIVRIELLRLFEVS